ncbi:hypothetical protein K435DRAFT_869143 [Dendrothele bispora CBS 962.96]|uniref:Uncharacterized protein n=1 Tax=Dendrothele bispora (strain CBS 962.96) TaxID=1314807 RepID=A0A4S8L9W3_DENBC|nr:hypothetical protein K435DRAFT_869143 [Dendrothele bispora CBS 962.96]
MTPDDKQPSTLALSSPKRVTINFYFLLHYPSLPRTHDFLLLHEPTPSPTATTTTTSTVLNVMVVLGNGINTTSNDEFQFSGGMSSLTGLVGGSLGGATDDMGHTSLAMSIVVLDSSGGQVSGYLIPTPFTDRGGFSTLGKNKAWVDLWKLGGAPPVSPLFESPPSLSAAVLAHPPMGYPTAADNVRGRGGVRRIDRYRLCKSERRV